MVLSEKITTLEIEVKVASHFNYRQNIIVPNVSWGVNLHECDLLIIRKSGYGIEVEIKVTKSDLKADAKKPHEHTDRMDRLSELYFAIPDYMKNCVEYIPERAGILLVSKHDGYFGLSMLRSPQINKNRRKFTDSEMLKVAHLGTMRIWNLKRTINSYCRKLKKKRTEDLLQQTLEFN
jgi:hypothetical protein